MTMTPATTALALLAILEAASVVVTILFLTALSHNLRRLEELLATLAEKRKGRRDNIEK